MEKIFRNQIKQDPFLEGPIEIDEKIREELRSKVEKHYQANNVPENLIEQFIIHNDQVEYFVDRFSMEEKFNEKETEIALLS
ncbi:MAG: hypothetical protein KAU07_00520, partial [Candidatus Andersenbacteria bacterium]|nr:hypothetical protein [Candidatus Andersenbacteria bacterium]